MRNELFFVAALLVPGLAYGGNPSANLSIQIVPAGQNNGSILPSGNWNLVFDDEFNGTSIDTAKWNVDADYKVDSGQYCDKNSTQLTVSGGFANFQAFNVSGTPCPAGTTGGANLWSLNRYGPGYFEARLKGDPTGGGPAGGSGFWMIGGNYDCQGDMTHGFESDIIEYWNSSGHNAVHWNGYGNCASIADQGGGLTAGDNFHIWGMLYDQNNGATFYRDGVQTFTWNAGCSASTPCTTPLIIKFNNNMNMSACCDFSHPMQVDWVRYYQRAP
jgi:beta-glucanase (GH16 family)